MPTHRSELPSENSSRSKPSSGHFSSLYSLIVPLGGSAYLREKKGERVRHVALGAVETRRRVLHVLHEALADAAARERLSRLRQQRKLGLEKRVHRLCISENTQRYADMVAEEDELGAEDVERVLHYVLLPRLSLRD